MRSKSSIIAGIFIGLLSLFLPYTEVSAGTVTATETCNVAVYFTATVPDSVEQGKSLTVSNITVQPANSYGFTVTSSTLTMSATNTTSSSYSQNSYATNPSPTTGHSTYVAYYPNWVLDASGPAGGSIAIQLQKSLTVIQGYGGSPVTCKFSKILATIPITAQAAPSSPSQPSSPSTPSSPTQPSPSSASTPAASSSANSTFSVGTSVTGTPANTSTSPTPTNSSSAAAAPDTLGQTVDQSVSVIPLTVKVQDASGDAVSGASVTLDGSKKLTTDSKGKVIFSNVLTGNHAILVSYKGQKITQNITLSAESVGKMTSVNLPQAPIDSGTVIAIAVAAGAIIIGAIGTFILRRKRAAFLAAQSVSLDTSLHNIISGSAIPSQPALAITHIPAIPVFTPQPVATTAAPWAPTASGQPTASTAPMPESPIGLEPAMIQHFAPAASTLPAEQAVISQPTPQASNQTPQPPVSTV